MSRFNGARGPGKPRRPSLGRHQRAVLEHPERWFWGERTPEGLSVCVQCLGPPEAAIPLPPRHDLWDHSPTGYEWGYGGSGPAQLALAILANVLLDDDLAVVVHQHFKAAVIARLPKEGWCLTIDQVRDSALSAWENSGRPGPGLDAGRPLSARPGGYHQGATGKGDAEREPHVYRVHLERRDM